MFSCVLDFYTTDKSLLFYFKCLCSIYLTKLNPYLFGLWGYFEAKHQESNQEQNTSLFKTYLVVSKKYKLETRKISFSFPLEVLIAVPLTLIVSASLATVDRRIRFTILYPSVFTMIGLTIPLYIVLKNPKMTKLFKQRFYENPKKKFLHLLQSIKKCCSTSVQPISVDH